jgi:hypothetical protein
MKHSASQSEIDGNEQGLAVLEIDVGVFDKARALIEGAFEAGWTRAG